MEIRRIVIAVDASPTSQAAIQATAELAAAWGAELLGIFVEDVNLLRMASLPFASEVGSHSGKFRRIDPDNLRRQLRWQAERARRELESAARALGVTVVFRVARGRVNEELLAALSEADLLSLGKGGKTLAARLGLGSTARAIAAGASGRVLLLSHVSRVAGPVVAVYDGSPSGERALASAMELARGLKTDLTVLCLAETRERAQELATRVEEATEDFQRIRCRHCTTGDVPDLARIARSFGANAMVVPAGGAVLRDETVEDLLKSFSGPVLIVADRS
ncbi:MAG: universal stress protein [Gemmatimonadales bacterium]|jgi:nucleotide-binding universal stress UspA family protein